MGPCGYLSAGKTNEPLLFLSRVTVATVESVPKPSPRLQHFPITLLNPGAMGVTVVSPLTSEQYSGETTEIWQPRVSSELFSESTLRASKKRSPWAGNN